VKITNLNPHTTSAPARGSSISRDTGCCWTRACIRSARDASAALYSLAGPGELDAIVISHCHHDHVGSLPVAVRQFPRAHVLMTELSYFLVETRAPQLGQCHDPPAGRTGITEYPLFTHDEVDGIESLFQGFRYGREIDWSAFQRRQVGYRLTDTRVPRCRPRPRGRRRHGPRGERNAVLLGDVSFRDQTLLKGARFEDVQADVLILETTRGARETPAGFSREAEIERLAEAIRDVQARKGCVLIPAFALGRTQEILALLALLMQAGRLPANPCTLEAWDASSPRSTISRRIGPTATTATWH